jgi:hypothetical protein
LASPLGAKPFFIAIAEGTDPMKSILDPSFQYTNSLETDLRKTFARVRREMRKEQQQADATNVQPLRRELPTRRRAGSRL